jgi:hypothetical protein
MSDQDQRPNEESYGDFTERGYRVTVHISAEGAPHFVIRAMNAETGEQVREEAMPPLMYGAIFGVDVSDHAALEERVDALLAELPDLSKKDG